MSKYYAQLNAENIVVGVSELASAVDEPLFVELEHYDLSVIGKRYENGEFIAAPAQAIRKITRGRFRSRMTIQEKLQIKIGAKTDPMLELFQDELRDSSHADLDDPDLISGLDYLVSKNILTESRKAEILADGTPVEAWQGQS